MSVKATKPTFADFDPRGRRDAPGAMPKWVQYRVAWEVPGGVLERFFDDMGEAFDWCRRQREAGAGAAVFRQHVKESMCGCYPPKGAAS